MPKAKIPDEEIIGKIYPTKRSGKFKVISFAYYDLKYNFRIFNVKFIKTGYLTTATLSDIRVGKVRDQILPIVCGIGFVGHPNKENLTKNQYISLKKVWAGMMHRCFNEKNPFYKNYGALGVFVDKRWFDFSVFLEDVQKLPNWDLKLKNWNQYTLNKEYKRNEFGKFIYSKDTCNWLSKKDQNNFTKRTKPIIAISPTGEKSIHLSVYNAVRALGLKRTSIYNSLNNGTPHFLGWKFINLENQYQK